MQLQFQRHVLVLSVATLFWGCGSTATFFTNDVRGDRTLKELQDFRYYTSADLDFVSAQTNVPTLDAPLRSPNSKRLSISRTTPGVAVEVGQGWIAVDFGQGVVLTFRLSAEGTYVLPAWGTITVAGERYDFQMGVLTGTLIGLEYRVAAP